ncbi:hypothetical protein D3C76_428070 [compost metagenome]
MKLTRYLYSGPQSSVCLRVGEQSLEVALLPGAETKLPADHDYTQVLLELNHLVPIDGAEQPDTAPATAESGAEPEPTPAKKGAK